MRRGSIVVAGLAACSFQHGTTPPGNAMPDGPERDDGQIAPHDGAIDAPIDAGPTGLIAWYQMETIASGQAPDATGNGHTGTCASSACPLIEPSPRGQGYLFSSGDRIDVAPDGQLAAMTGLTVAFWVTLQTAAAYACPVQKGLGGGANNSWQFCFEPPNATMYFWTSTASVDILRSATAMPINQWHHIAITWDGSTKQVWFDGTSVATDTGLQITWDIRDVTIGADIDDLTTDDSVNDLPGALDDLRIYDHALTAPEIFALAH